MVIVVYLTQAILTWVQMKLCTSKAAIMLALVGTLAAPVTAFGAIPCEKAVGTTTRSEGEIAIEVRRLQTTLMVAALSCNARSYYNDFVIKYRARLQHFGKAIRVEFRRRYGQYGSKKLDRFVTHVANKASARSNANRATFCSEALTFFQQTAARDTVLASIVAKPAPNRAPASATCEAPTEASFYLGADESSAQNR